MYAADSHSPRCQLVLCHARFSSVPDLVVLTLPVPSFSASSASWKDVTAFCLWLKVLLCHNDCCLHVAVDGFHVRVSSMTPPIVSMLGQFFLCVPYRCLAGLLGLCFHKGAPELFCVSLCVQLNLNWFFGPLYCSWVLTTPVTVVHILPHIALLLGIKSN